jgi:serine protease Do
MKMNWKILCGLLLAALALLAIPYAAPAQKSVADVAEQVNKKLVKIFGAGGIRGLPHYGTGIVISADGYVLTANSHILDTADLRVHLYDGTRMSAKVVCIEPELDVALLKIGTEKDELDLPFFNVVEAAKRPVAEAGTGILGFSNLFEIATRNEPMSVQQGRVAAYAKLHGRIGIFEAPYTGQVYVVDAITNNPGAAGGALTTRKGELLGIIGKELRNEQTNTWINYAMPIQAKIEVLQADGKKITVALLDLVEKKEKYKPIDPKERPQGGGGYTGIVLVPNVVDRTPPYVEDVLPGSPAESAGVRPDDLIVYVDGLPVPSIQMYNETIGKYRPNTEVKLEVRREDKLSTLTVKLTDPPKKPKPQ